MPCSHTNSALPFSYMRVCAWGGPTKLVVVCISVPGSLVTLRVDCFFRGIRDGKAGRG